MTEKGCEVFLFNRTQTTGLGVMINRFFLDRQFWGIAEHPANIGSSNFRYANNDQSIHLTQKHQRKKKTWEDKKKSILLIS